MAWTTPRTWTDGELVTKSIMDTHIRDNLNALGPHLIVRKTADETVTSSTALQNDDSLLMSVGVSEVWRLEWIIIYSAATAGDIKIGWTFPTGAKINTHTITTDSSGSSLTDNLNFESDFASGGSGTVGTTAASPDYATLFIPMIYVGGANSGTLQLQWAQGTSSGTATAVKANSTLWGVKLV